MNDSDHVVAIETVSDERLRTHLSVDGWSAMKSLTSSEVRSLVSELLASRLAKQAPDGWVLAPKDPTADMTAVAVRHAFSVEIGSEYTWAQYMTDLYKIMLAAAPSPVGGSVS